MKKAKQKIDACVRQYKKVFKDEYKQFLKQTKSKEKREQDDIFKKDSPIKRAVWDMPATLYNIIINKLEPKELEWFNKKGYSGGQWYIRKTFEEFRVPDKI